MEEVKTKIPEELKKKSPNEIKIYLGGSCSPERRDFMREIGYHLKGKGYNVYLPFDLKIPNAYSLPQLEWGDAVADEDLKAIDEADIFLMMSEGRVSSAGTNFEQGYAYAKNKVIFVIQYMGHTTSLMTTKGCTLFKNSYVSDVFDTIDDFLNFDKAEQMERICTTYIT